MINDLAASLLNELSEQKVELEPATEPVPEPALKYKKQSLEEQTGRETTHVHALLFADDLDALKEIAYRQRKSTNELIRDILDDYVQNPAYESENAVDDMPAAKPIPRMEPPAIQEPKGALKWSVVSTLSEDESVWIVSPEESNKYPWGWGFVFRCIKCGNENTANCATPYCPICGRKMLADDLFDTTVMLGGPSRYFEKPVAAE